MKYFSFWILLFVTLLMITSCERVVDLHLRDDTGLLVIEGNITDQPGEQTIELSKNIPFSEPGHYPKVSGATIQVTDDQGHTYHFTETAAGIYTTEDLTGRYGHQYNLNIVLGDTTYTATSIMPDLVHLDSLSARKEQWDDEDRERVLSVHYQDPVGLGNQYQFILYVNGHIINKVFTNSDRLSDGRKVTFDLEIDDDDLEIIKGDSVKVIMQCIDLNMYTYWNSLEQQQGSDGMGGGVSPANPPTNISPAVLGYFSAHTAESAEMVVK